MHELASESTYANARRRTFNSSVTTLSFTETIYTVDYRPGLTEYAYQIKSNKDYGDFRFVDESGRLGDS